MFKNKRNTRKIIIVRDKAICCYCRIILNNNTATIEHIIPKSKGGKDILVNTTIACQFCNKKRSSIDFFEYLSKYYVENSRLLKYKKLYFLSNFLNILDRKKNNDFPTLERQLADMCLNRNNQFSDNKLVNTYIKLRKLIYIDSYLDAYLTVCKEIDFPTGETDVESFPRLIDVKITNIFKEIKDVIDYTT